ncbi:MAG: hypothetical protein ACP5U1_14105 [Desulfomonilaceae bacterium]
MSKKKWLFLTIAGAGILYILSFHSAIPLTPTQQRIRLVDSIVKDYARSHTYSKKDLFVCVDMAVDLWNRLQTQGVKTIIKAGSVSKDMSWLKNDARSFLREMDHVWLLFEVENGKYLPLETTGGFIVFSDAPNSDRYFVGPEFDTPRQFKRFMEARNRFFTVCEQAERMRNGFNKIFAGRRITRDSLEAKGMCEFKAEECLEAQKELLESIERHR